MPKFIVWPKNSCSCIHASLFLFVRLCQFACSMFVCSSVVVPAHLLRRKIVGVLYARGMRVKQLLRVRVSHDV